MSTLVAFDNIFGLIFTHPPNSLTALKSAIIVKSQQ